MRKMCARAPRMANHLASMRRGLIYAIIRISENDRTFTIAPCHQIWHTLPQCQLHMSINSHTHTHLHKHMYIYIPHSTFTSNAPRENAHFALFCCCCCGGKRVTSILERYVSFNARTPLVGERIVKKKIWKNSRGELDLSSSFQRSCGRQIVCLCVCVAKAKSQ